MAERLPQDYFQSKNVDASHLQLIQSPEQEVKLDSKSLEAGLTMGKGFEKFIRDAHGDFNIQDAVDGFLSSTAHFYPENTLPQVRKALENTLTFMAQSTNPRENWEIIYDDPHNPS